jgi:hypothetical protein
MVLAKNRCKTACSSTWPKVDETCNHMCTTLGWPGQNDL